MPENVEVCLSGLFLNHMLQNHKLTDLKILDGKYLKNELEGKKLFDNNKPYTINKIDTKGKFMWFKISNNNNIFYILNRFGLTGEWSFIKQDHSNVVLEIDNKINLYFVDMRNFGSLSITDKKSDLDYELNELGPDYLKTDFTNDDFHNRIKQYLFNNKKTISKSRGEKEIVKVLMEQKKDSGLGAGIGNYLVAEILYHAKISPHTQIIKIYQNKLLSDTLAYSIKYIIKKVYMTADIGYFEYLDKSTVEFIKELRDKINNDDNHNLNFHKDIKINKNDIFKFNVYGQKTDLLGNKITADKIITGRTTYWSPNIQK